MQQEQGVWNVSYMYGSGSEKMQNLHNSPFYAFRKNINNMSKSFKRKSTLEQCWEKIPAKIWDLQWCWNHTTIRRNGTQSSNKTGFKLVNVKCQRGTTRWNTYSCSWKINRLQKQNTCTTGKHDCQPNTRSTRINWQSIASMGWYSQLSNLDLRGDNTKCTTSWYRQSFGRKENLPASDNQQKNVK